MTPNDENSEAPGTTSGPRARAQDRVLALILLCVAAIFWVDSANISAAEARMFPRLILGALILLAVLLFARSFRLPIEARSEPVITDRTRFALFVGTTIIYAAGVPIAGFFTASAIYMPLAAYLVGLRRPWMNLLVTAIFLAATYLVFVTLFSRPLPAEFPMRFL